MAQCPVCASNIPDEFGLIECESCGAQLLVHVDGRVEHSGEAAPAEAQSQPFFQSKVDVEPNSEPPEFALEDSDEVIADEPEPVPEEKPFDGEPEPEPEVYQAAPAASPASPDLSDIARFGNSDASSHREGSLRYNLFVSGIDTSDVREAFREAITDRKFMWDTDQILRAIRDGEVQISGVAAAKAYMLITRLRSLPVQVRWEQYAIQQN